MHVAITGASSGIGAALAREYARAGARVTLVARRRELLDKLRTELGPACFIAAHDLSDPDHAADWIAPAEAALGPIDVMVNNAGMENTVPIAESDVEVDERLLRLNLHSPLRITRALLPAMLARGSGTIVNVCSVAGLAAPPGQSVYGASKAGLAMFSETLRSEIRRTGVNVLTVYPGPVTTPMGERAYEALGGRQGAAGLAPEGRPEELAGRIRVAVEHRSPRLIYPRFYVLARWFPWFARWLIDRVAPLPLSQKR